jgi:WD40 repeat protein
MLGDSADTPVGKPAVSKKEEDKNQKFILQDLGQYGYLVTKHPFLDENSSTYKPEFVKRAISRPLSLVVQKETSLVTHAAMCPSGLKLALTTSEGILRLYDLRGQKPKQVYYTSAHDHMALCLAWLPDGSGLFTGGADWTVRMWSGEDLSFLGSEMRHLGYVRCVATSHDGNWAASGSSDLAILLFSTSPFKYDDVKLQGHTSWVRWVHFSHDNNRLISGGDDQTIIIWNMMTHNQMQTLRAHSHTISAGVSLPNNKLFTAGFDENLLLWSQDTGLLGYLKVFVAEAFDLPRSDILSGSMSNQRFAKIELGKGQQFETKFKSGRNPQWYEEFNLDVWNVDEHVSIEIYDWDKDEQHRFLASLSVPVEELVCADEGITDREYDMLDEEGNLSKSLISVRFTFRHVRCTGELTVNVEKARDLPRMDTFGLADPFAALTCGKGTRYKTQVKKNSLNPIWNEEFIFNVEENARELKIVLYDWSITKEEDFIGQVLIPTSDIEANPYRDEWFKLKDLDGTTDVKGEVKLCIQFIPESERDSTAIRFRRNPASWPVGEKADFNHFAPVGQIKLFGRTILRGKCKHCNLHRYQHSKNLRCDLGTGNYFHSLAINKTQTLLACGTGDGRIRVSILSTGQQIACWTAHAGPVAGLQFANGDDRLVSWGPDCRGVTLSDYSHGSYMPANASNRETGKRSSVEVWYVASMICAVEIYKKKMMGIVETFEDNEEKNEDNESDDDEAFSLADLDEDDDDDETLTAEERAEKKSEREKRLAKQALSLSRRRGKGGQLGSMPGARVGYTPVYYPPPMLPDGSHARSCLKGRGRQEAMRAGLSWGETEFDNLEIHFYPPENPVEGEGESDDSDSTPSKNKRNQGANAAAKKKRTEEIARERARKRQMEKDIELFGKPVSVQRSQSVSPERPREGDESPTRVSSPDPIASVSLTRTSSDESIRSPSITSPGAGSKQRGRAKLSPYGKNQHEQEQENLEDDFGLVTISADTVAAEKKQKSPKGRKEEGKSPKKSAKSQSTPPEVPAEGAKKPKSKSVSKSTADASSSETPKKAKKAGRKSSPKNPEES